jgi:hypothetical protein
MAALLTSIVQRGLSRAALAVLLPLSACDAPGVISPMRTVVGIGGTQSAASQLIGAWRRSLFFVDDFGFSHSTETTWEFQPDGSALRTVVTRNLSVGLADVTLTSGRWRVEDSRLQIDFVSPQPGSILLQFRVEASRLVLADETYERVA